MRKSLSLILVCTLLLALSACGSQEEAAPPVAETIVESAAPAATAAPTAAPTEPADAGAISWRISNGVLTISGQGPMDDYELLCAPWDESGESFDVEKLVVEEGVTYLGTHAFAACPNLAEVILPRSLRGIGSFCFADCSALEKVSFSEGLLYIGSSAFTSSGLTELILPDGLAGIGDMCFSFCASLKTLRVPDSLCSLGENAFVDCAALEQIEMGRGATADTLLGAEGFGALVTYSGTAIPAGDYPWSGEVDGCSWALQKGVLTLSGGMVPNFSTTGGLLAPWAPMADLITEVHVAEGISAIGDYAFWDCSRLNRVMLPASVEYIGAYAFGACEALAGLDFPAALDSIGAGAFSFCTVLKRADLPEGLVHIGDDAFHMCSSLERISIPESVTEIGSGALTFGSIDTEIVTAPGSYAEQWVKDNL